LSAIHQEDDMASPEVIEQSLRLRRSELLQRAERVDADLRHERDPLVADFADQAIQRSNDEVLREIGDSAKDELRQIDLALRRLIAGQYFICASCGGDIEDARLAALPATTLCAVCAQGSR
jgi:RNA polymerase-binding transcription factor DksA